MEADSIHSSIERANRSTKVYHPSQWDTVVSMARKRNPYIVIPLNYRDFQDFKSIKNRFEYEFGKAVAGEAIKWFKMKWIKITKDCPASIFFNYNFDEGNCMEAQFWSCCLRRTKKDN